MIINRGAAEVDTSRDDISDFHPLGECNIYFIIPNRTLNPLFIISTVFSLMPTMVKGVKRENNAQILIYVYA